MSTATWGEPEPQAEDKYPLSLLKNLLLQMMKQFAANGACIALYDEKLGQMVIRLHMRVHSPGASVMKNATNIDNISSSGRRTTIDLKDPSSSALQRLRPSLPSKPLRAEDVEVVTSTQNHALFPVGAAYPPGQDLIGYTWRSTETYILRHEDYLSWFYPNRKAPLQLDSMPTWYLSVPLQEPQLIYEARGKKEPSSILGVIVLYQTTLGLGFHQKQRAEALQFAERIALYIQNDNLRRLHLRTRVYMKGLQEISTAFPTAVKLANLIENVYAFVTSVVDVSSMLLTFYDRDTNKIYDVFAMDNGTRMERLLEQPEVALPEDRPVWWRVTQQEKQTLMLTLGSQEHGTYGEYEELMKGIWGDQSKAETFLLLPMKMFTRVVGSLCLTSMRPYAYSPEEILVLETMVQIITVSIENAKLYDRSRHALLRAKQREESLAAMNSALLAISAVLNVAELLHKFVETVAKLVQAEICTFFQLSSNEEKLVAQAVYDTTGKWKGREREREAAAQAPGALSNQDQQLEHDDLIGMIRLPFKGSLLERLVEVESFFYLNANEAEELAQASEEGGAMFLRETHIRKMLMIPVRYQTEIVGILAIHTPEQNRVYRPEEVGVLLAISAQAASAIRNAQLFEQIQEAYAELQRMDKLKDEFIVTASHELRTPLSAISGYSSLLKRQSGRITPQQILRFASKIAGSAQQLNDLVSNMTEAAKMGALEKKLDLQSGPVQVLAAAEMASNMLSVNIEQKISLHIPEDLWVNCDALRLRQVITNLLDNAAKYSPPQSRIIVTASATTLSNLPEHQVDYSVLAEGEDPAVALVRVCDEGEGIPLEDQQRIFEKFVRATRSLTTPIRGSGLGLYICRRYIEAMGGRLWLEQSIPGEGSVFTFSLPRIDAPIEIREQDEQDEQDG